MFLFYVHTFSYMLFNLFMVKNNILNVLVSGVERIVFLEF